MDMLKWIVTPALMASALMLTQGPAVVLTPEVKAQTVTDLAKAMRDSYAYPETGKKAADSVEQKLKSDNYAAITDPTEFATRVTKDLNDVCHDAHLHLIFSEQPLPVRKDRAEPSPDEIKADQERTHYVNAAFTKVERMDGNIGYLSFRNFLDPEISRRPVKAAMEFLADTDALIIDIRQNGGGDPATVQLICSYFFDDKPVHLNDLVQRDGKRIEFWTLKKVDGPRYLNKDIYVLTSKRTGSAAEEFSYNLKNLKRATIVGEPTWGGANPGGTYRLNDHFGIFIPHAHAESPITHTNWEGTGVLPDVAVDPKNGLATAYQMALQKELAKTTDPDRKKMLEQVLNEQETKKSG